MPPRKKSPHKKNPAKPAAKKAKPSKVDPTHSKSFRDASARASRYKNDPERLKKLFEEAAKKSEQSDRGTFKEKWAYLMAMIRLVRAYATGQYRQIPWQSMATIIAAVIYFVSPLDFIPDWIPVAGYLDDAFVVGLAIKSVKDELDAFMQWENRHGPT